MSLLRKHRGGLTVLLALALSALLLLSFACGGDDDGGGAGTGTPAATTPANTGNGGGGEVTFDVSMGDNFFDPKEFTVSAGASVTFNITNDGAAIHNMRIAGEDGDYSTDDDSVSDPDLVNGGGTATLEWTAPSKAGEITFQCDFHAPSMAGTITVE